MHVCIQDVRQAIKYMCKITVISTQKEEIRKMKAGMKSPECYLSEFLNLTKISQRWITSNLVMSFILSDVTNCQ